MLCQKLSHSHRAINEAVGTWMAWAGTALPSTRPVAKDGQALLIYLPWSGTCETWTGLSLLTGAWVTPAKEGLASMRFHLCALSHVCAQCGAPITSLASQISIAIITHISQARTLCMVQHTAQLALH